MPTMVDDGHNTSIDHAAQCLQHQLFLLFSNGHFNDETPIVLVSTRTIHMPKIAVSWRCCLVVREKFR